MSVHPESEPHGFDGLASLVSVLRESAAGPTAPKHLAPTAPPSQVGLSRSAKEPDLVEPPKGITQSYLRVAAVAFGLSFALTGVFLVMLTSRNPNLQTPQSKEPQIANT